jgi:hypothetical protein
MRYIWVNRRQNHPCVTRYRFFHTPRDSIDNSSSLLVLIEVRQFILVSRLDNLSNMILPIICSDIMCGRVPLGAGREDIVDGGYYNW